MIDQRFPPLITARLLLRCVTHDDAPTFSALMTSQVSRWVASWPHPLTLEMAASRIEAARKLADAGDALPFGVVEKASNALIGFLTINRDPHERRRASLSYWLGEAYQGKGYMSELAPIALEASFERLDIDIVEAGAQPANAASFAVMRACGMRPTREAMVYAPSRGQVELCQFYEIRREQYRRMV
jgi:ribosomal-protein-alanine N-acetyltransferase